MKRKENLNRDTDTTLKLHFYIMSLWLLFVLLFLLTVDIPISFSKDAHFIGVMPLLKRNWFATGTTWNCFCLYGKAKVGWCFKSAI